MKKEKKKKKEINPAVNLSIRSLSNIYFKPMPHAALKHEETSQSVLMLSSE